MKYAIHVLLLLFALFAFESAQAATMQLDAKDATTADGSCRAGLHSGKVYCILTAINTGAVLQPDSWSSDDESVQWNRWLVDFDNNLFNNWVNSDPGEGQQTVLVRIANGTIKQDAGHFFSGANSDQSKFAAAITSSMEKTLKSAPPVPQTKNPLKEIRYGLTFMCDAKMAPRFGREQLGFMAVLDDSNKDVIVYGRNKDGREPGIQIISDSERGSIQVTDKEQFLQNCRAADARLAGK